jgi:glycosyltransferase involved in cell wall biosynthesis
LPAVSELDRFVVRRFATSIGTPGLTVAAGLREYLRRMAASLDVVHAHTAHAPFALAAARVGAGPFVFTPHAPVQRLVRWPYAHLTRAVVQRVTETVCTSSAEGDLLRGRFPWAANRIRVVPNGVDVAAIQSARPFAEPGIVVLAVGRLERHRRVDRAIAAIVGLDPAFRLVVVGTGNARPRLRAHAADLKVASRVRFVGSIPDHELYRWLRTARVVLALSEQDTSGSQVSEGLSAGVPVVASDIPVHREAASHGHGAGVVFVSPEGSPLEVVDAISNAARIRVSPATPLAVPTWSRMVDSSLALYERLAIRGFVAAGAHGDGMALGAPGSDGGRDVTVAR